MTNYFWAADLISIMRREEESSNGNIENVLNFIIELEQSGQYSYDNICNLKRAYYSRIDDNSSALYWMEQALTYSPNNVGYLFEYFHILMKLGLFRKSLCVISKVIDLDKELLYYTNVCIFAKSICYYYLKDYKNCYHYLKDLDDDFSYWLAGGLHSKAEMMNVLRGFGY